MSHYVCAVNAYTYPILVLLLSLLFGGSSSLSATNDWISLFNGRNLDGWKVHEKSTYGTFGNVAVKDGVIEFEASLSYTAISLLGKFPTDRYELEISAKRTDGQDIFCGVLLPVGANYVSMVLGGWGNCIVGLSCIDRKLASGNETTLAMSFDNDRWYRVRVKVSPERFQAWVDNKQVIDMERKGRKISPYPGLEILAPFGLFSWGTSSAIKDVRYRSVRLSEKRR
jgi:hypothetical protein